MVATVILVVILAASGGVQCSGLQHIAAQLVPEPIVTAASSQYFERTINRLVAALEPVIPVAPAPPVNVVPVAAAAPTVFVEPVSKSVPVPQNVPVEPNVAIAVATAHAAAPIATILLPPYPFGPPLKIGFIPSSPPIVVPDESKKKFTTESTTSLEVSTSREVEAISPLPQPSNTDNSFAQPLPTYQNVNFRQYYAPPLPQVDVPKPQKLKTSVEIVPVPLQYIAPPSLQAHHHHHHVHSKPIKYVHAFVPSRIIIKPAPMKIRTVKLPVRLVLRKRPVTARNIVRPNPNSIRSRSFDTKDREPTTFSPFNQPATKPPK